MQTKVILLERIAKLGQLGDVVSVKSGYARNYLLPFGKALRANKSNMAYFESRRQELEARNLELRTEAESVSSKLDNLSVIAIRSAGETGQLYGSVASRDVVAILAESGFKIDKSQVLLSSPIKMIGLHSVGISLHADVDCTITVNVARSTDEADRQASGESTDPTIVSESDESTLKPEDVFEKEEDIADFESSAADDTESTDSSDSPDDENNDAIEVDEVDKDK